jgi:deoxycytidylate deaminase
MFDNFLFYCLQKAVQASQKSMNKNKHGCVIFKKNKILAVGYNKMINLLSLKHFGYVRGTIHAETDALLKTERNFRNAEMIVIRYGKLKLKNSKPCSSCIAMVKEYGIKTVYYTNKYGILDKMDVI